MIDTNFLHTDTGKNTFCIEFNYLFARKMNIIIPLSLFEHINNILLFLKHFIFNINCDLNGLMLQKVPQPKYRLERHLERKHLISTGNVLKQRRRQRE